MLFSLWFLILAFSTLVSLVNPFFSLYGAVSGSLVAAIASNMMAPLPVRSERFCLRGVGPKTLDSAKRVANLQPYGLHLVVSLAVEKHFRRMHLGLRLWSCRHDRPTANELNHFLSYKKRPLDSPAGTAQAPTRASALFAYLPLIA